MKHIKSLEKHKLIFKKEVNMILYISRYALSKGIIEKNIPDFPLKIGDNLNITLNGDVYPKQIKIGRDAFLNLENAKRKASHMRYRKIQSLKQQIKKLEGFKFG